VQEALSHLNSMFRVAKQKSKENQGRKRKRIEEEDEETSGAKGKKATSNLGKRQRKK
jgi:hypothetical protein